jgi:hypothetical protein
MVADQMGVQFDVGRGCPMIAKRVATQGLAYLLATDDRQTERPSRAELREGAGRCTAGDASKIKVIPLAAMAELYRRGKLDPSIGDAAVAAE